MTRQYGNRTLILELITTLLSHVYDQSTDYIIHYVYYVLGKCTMQGIVQCTMAYILHTAYIVRRIQLISILISNTVNKYVLIMPYKHMPHRCQQLANMCTHNLWFIPCSLCALYTKQVASVNNNYYITAITLPYRYYYYYLTNYLTIQQDI